MISSGTDFMGRRGAHGAHYYKWLGIGDRQQKNSKQETDQIVLTMMKALIKTTNCTCRAKKVDGHDQKHFMAFAPDVKLVCRHW